MIVDARSIQKRFSSLYYPDLLEGLAIDDYRDSQIHGEMGDDEYIQIFRVEEGFFEVVLAGEFNRYDKQYYYYSEEVKLVSFKEVFPTPEEIAAREWEVSVIKVSTVIVEASSEEDAKRKALGTEGVVSAWVEEDECR